MARQQAEQPGGLGGEAEAHVDLILWKNGFQVDEGEFRAYEDPANKAFMDEVHAGRIPRELLGRGTNIDVTLIDRKTKDYVAPPKPKYLGTAAWGAAAPAAAQGGGTAAAAAPAAASRAVDKSTIELTQNKSTVLQLVFGSVRVRCNVDEATTVGAIRAAAAERAGSPAATLSLKGEVLSDDAATVGSLGLKRSTLTVA